MGDSGVEHGDGWQRLDRHEWTDESELETSLLDALDSLDVGDSDVLYKYVDLDAVRDILAGQGTTEVRFEYERYEVRITSEGQIAVR